MLKWWKNRVQAHRNIGDRTVRARCSQCGEIREMRSEFVIVVDAERYYCVVCGTECYPPS